MSARVLSNTDYETLRVAVRAEMRAERLTSADLAQGLRVDRRAITNCLSPTPNRQPRLLLLLAAYLGVEPA